MKQHIDTKSIPFAEFIALMAIMMSLVALSIDAMLPALPQIGLDLHVLHVNDNQLIISLLFLGFGLGQIIYGPLSDSFGRKPAIYIGLSLAIAGCLLSIFADSYLLMLAGRFLQGLGLASARVITIAIVRDKYHGNEMGKVMSFIMTIFILVPTLAPAIGQGILFIADWRMIFTFILGLSITVLLWFAIRQNETLAASQRTAFSIANIIRNIQRIFMHRVVMGYTIISGLIFSTMLGYLNSAQQIFQDQYQLGTMFPAYFGILALSIGLASLTNAKLVMTFGMHDMSKFALIIISTTSVLFFIIAYNTAGHPQLWQLMCFLLVVLFCFGILIGNLNALAMEPLGHMAGLGASLVGALSTFIAIPFGMLIGQSYDNSVLPLIAGFALLSLISLAVMHWVGLVTPDEL